MNEPKFKIAHCKNGIEMGMPEEYYEKLRIYCNENHMSLSVYIKMKLEECNYVMSDFYKIIETM